MASRLYATVLVPLLLCTAIVNQVVARTDPVADGLTEVQTLKVVRTQSTGRQLLTYEGYEKVDDPNMERELHRLLPGDPEHPTTTYMVAADPTIINQTQIALNGLSDSTTNQVQQAISQMGNGFNTAIQIVIIDQKSDCGDKEGNDKKHDNEKHDKDGKDEKHD